MGDGDLHGPVGAPPTPGATASGAGGDAEHAKETGTSLLTCGPYRAATLVEVVSLKFSRSMVS